MGCPPSRLLEETQFFWNVYMVINAAKADIDAWKEDHKPENN